MHAVKEYGEENGKCVAIRHLMKSLSAAATSANQSWGSVPNTRDVQRVIKFQIRKIKRNSAGKLYWQDGQCAPANIPALRAGVVLSWHIPSTAGMDGLDQHQQSINQAHNTGHWEFLARLSLQQCHLNHKEGHLLAALFHYSSKCKTMPWSN